MQSLDKFAYYKDDVTLNLRQVNSKLNEFELKRTQLENRVLNRYKSAYIDNSKDKKIIFKLCSKICKVNYIFLTKIQTFYPRLYEIIMQEAHLQNTSFKEDLFELLAQEKLFISQLF